MRVDVLGRVSVTNGEATVSDQALGGRRARVALVALALAGGQVSAERLASVIWADSLPSTWQVALRGVIRGLRTACEPVSGEGQHLIATAPAGYRLADGIDVDVDLAAAALQKATTLLADGRHQAAVDAAEPISRMSGDRLLPGEDAEWLDSHRDSINATALHAMHVVAEAAGLLGHHHEAIGAATRAIKAQPLDESGHRALIISLDRAGDRAGAVRAFERCRAQLADDLGIDPSGETVAAYLEALRDQAGTTTARLPSETTSFVGREDECRQLADALSTPGLVTLTGKGGVGKSRLAVHVAGARGSFPAGRLWVSVASAADDALVSSSVALEMGVATGVGDASLVVAEHLAPLGRVLLILDGCEALVDGVASLVASLLSHAPALTVLATSRMPLSIDGERVLTMEPLALPSGQVQILVDRVREAGGRLTLDNDIAPHLEALCRRCGGIPLALELVAAQLAAMPPGDLLDHLDDVSTESDETGLRAVARSSYLLLEDDEATVFRRLAVLDGQVGLPLVRAVVSDASITPVRVVRILRELSARGLLGVDRSGPRWRYQQDDDLHRFARDQLVEAREERPTYARLADAIRAQLPDDARAAPAPFAAEITDMLGSVRSLFGSALTGHTDLDRCRELAFRLHRYFATTSVAEGRFWLSRLLGAGEDGPWTPYATYALGYLSYWAGDAGNAVPELQSAVELLEGVEDPYVARALIFLAGLLDDLDRGAESLAYVRRSIDAAAPFDVDLQVSAAMGMGSVLAERGDSSAADYARDAIELCRRQGSAEHLALALPTATMVCWQVGALTEARTYAAAARPMHQATRRIARVVLLSVSAGLALADNDLAAAVDFGRTADEEATELGVEREVPLIRSVLARALLATGDVVGAADRAAAALDAALAVSIGHPIAVGLETAALVLADRYGNADDLAAMLGTADVIRRAGDRPGPATLAAAVDALRGRLGLDAAAVVRPFDPRATAARAIVLLRSDVEVRSG